MLDKSFAAVLFMTLVLGDVRAAQAASWTMMNPTGRNYTNEVLRIKLDIPDDISPDSYVVKEDGEDVAWQSEEIGGRKYVWVVTDLSKGKTHTYTLEPGKTRKAKPRVKVRNLWSRFTIDNGLIAAKIPSKATGLVGPVAEVRLPGGRWAGKSHWNTDRKLKRFSTELIGDGTVFAKVRLRYEFEGEGGLFDETPSFHQIDISLEPGKRHLIVEEEYAMGRGESWEFDCAAGWKARAAVVKPHFGGFGRPTMKDPEGNPYPWPPKSLKVGQTRMHDTLLNMVPRWSQAYDDGWFFMATDGRNGLGALVCRAGKWLWPYNSMIEVKVRESADYAGLRCPTWRGRRYWYLVAGPKEIWESDDAKNAYALRHACEGLDKLHQEYILDWPGLKPPEDAKLSAEQAADWNSGAGKFCRRDRAFPGWGPGGAHWTGPNHPITTLTRVQNMFDPDTYGDHWLYYSPENPNFFTHWVNNMFSGMETLKGHPQWKAIHRLAEQKFREELYHAVTLPGGAGQECFGYMARGSWNRRTKFCKEQLGFNPEEWPWQKAAGSFVFRTSHPMADGSRRSHPGGDTHPPGPEPFSAARAVGVSTDATSLKTEEFPGFGVVFHNRPGTPEETYFAFKSGPNRGHFHGDQLAFHYCAYGRPLAVDHHCSYGPRAGQEHMHNRVAFHTDDMPWANMDGYERLIAFKTSDTVDVAIGQVESERLREKTEFPPERWDWYLPQHKLDPNLKYRRTVVFLKNPGKQDCIVLRDQFTGPELHATYCLHVLGERCEREGNTFDFEGLRAVFIKPAEFEFSRHDWEHNNGGREATKGLRATMTATNGEFVTVLLARPVKRCHVAKLVLRDAVAYPVRPKGARQAKQTPFDLHVVFAWADGKIIGDDILVGEPRMRKGAPVFEGTVTVRDTNMGLLVNLKAEGVCGMWRKDRAKLDYTIKLMRPEGDKYTGSYAGTFWDIAAMGEVEKGKDVPGRQMEGELTGTFTKDALPPMSIFDGEWQPPAVEALPGGVRVGSTEVLFSGGIDDGDAATCVTVKRDGKDVLAVTGQDLDMNRSQGDIGIFVPDAGYPFGVMPDWLLRQRTGKPDWYRPAWPPTQ